MKFFIFRNNTLENIFGTDEVEYSGYEDISYIPQNTSLYLWMYQIPIRWNQKQLADEIDAYIRKMQLVFSQVPQGKEFVAFTLVDIFPTRFTDANFIVREAIVRYNTQLYNMAGTNVNFKVIDFSESIPTGSSSPRSSAPCWTPSRCPFWVRSSAAPSPCRWQFSLPPTSTATR